MIVRILALAAIVAAPALAAEATPAMTAPVAVAPGSAPAPALLPSAAASPAPTEVAAVAPAKKPRIICRRELEIGSLVKGTRRCGDAAMWRKSAEAAQTQARDMADQKGRYIVN